MCSFVKMRPGDKKLFFFLGILIITLVLGVVVYRVATAPVVTIGSWKIQASDIEARDKVVKIYFPGAAENAGRLQLEKSARYLWVLEKNGVTLSREDIVEEAARIDRSTQDSQTLARIKEIFGKDRESYLKNYVLPNLIERVLRSEFFPLNDDFHGESLKKAQAFVEEVRRNPEEFYRRAEQQSFPVTTIRVSLDEGIEWQRAPKDKKKQKEAGGIIDKSPQARSEIYERVLAQQVKGRLREAKEWHEGILKKLKESEVFPKPINTQEGWFVVRYKRKINDRTFEAEVVTIPKLNFDDWLRQELVDL